MRKFLWGYKVHPLVDTTHEIPMAANITKGNFADIDQATPLLGQARETYGAFHSEHVLCDAGYSSGKLRKAIEK